MAGTVAAILWQTAITIAYHHSQVIALSVSRVTSLTEALVSASRNSLVSVFGKEFSVQCQQATFLGPAACCLAGPSHVCVSHSRTVPSTLLCVVQIPHVNRQEYTLLDVSEDGYVSYFLCIYAVKQHCTLLGSTCFCLCLLLSQACIVLACLCKFCHQSISLCIITLSTQSCLKEAAMF